MKIREDAMLISVFSKTKMKHGPEFDPHPPAPKMAAAGAGDATPKFNDLDNMAYERLLLQRKAEVHE